MIGFLKAIEEMPEAEECHHVAVDDDYLLKVRCKDTEHLDKFLTSIWLNKISGSVLFGFGSFALIA